MGAHSFKFEVLLEVAVIFFAVCINVRTSSAQPGFLSIDCGSTRASYQDEIGLTWVKDDNYTLTGINSNSQGNVSSNVTDNRQALRDFRYFPEPRNKHCYELPTKLNTSYLIRAMFYYFESEALLLPIQFNVFINATNWFTVVYSSDATAGAPPNVQEGLFYSAGAVTYLCLQPVQGVPFISSLELRPLDAGGIMYSYSGSKRRYLSNLVRSNFVAAANAPTVRFPDDPFDRLWYSYPIPDDTISASVPPDNTTSAALNNNVPPKVMQDAWTNPGGIGVGLESSTPVSEVYAALYFEELNSTMSGRRYMSVYLDDAPDTGRFFNVTDRARMLVYPDYYLEGTMIQFEFDNEYNSSVNDGTILNALEVYGQYAFNFSTTYENDLQVVRALQTSFNLTDWQGDPCTPVPYDWLTCTDTQSEWTTFVQTLTLPNLTAAGFAVLNATLTTDGIWNATLTPGLFGTFWLSWLSELSITDGGVDTSIFEFLSDLLAYIDLSKLDLSYNDIDTLPASAANFLYLIYLNLSNNAFVGEVPSFVNMNFTNTLQELNFSYNAMTSFPTKWANMTALVVLDLSHNNLTGDIYSLDELVMESSRSLQKLYISDNNISGTFSDHLYFSGLPRLTIAKFDQNLIGGTLNLSLWLDLLKATLNANTSGPVTGQVFSFVNNKILDITPNAEVFQPTIDSLLKKITNFNKTGVLLGGNPYCKHAKSHTQRYLCRFTVEDKIPGGMYLCQILKKKEQINHNQLVVIFATIGGALAFVLFCILILTIWKLWNKVKVLEEIEKALADQQVQPRFYSYNDLKLATRNFHKDNKLGRGAFGVVYKGDLSDGTTLGVKTLFSVTQKAQVLNEFLNEVVLITGIKHKNLVQLKGCCIEYKHRILVYEYVENGNLAEALWGSRPGSLNWEQRFNICVGVARGLSYLHDELQPCIIHRDIKPANILLDNSLRPKIADFGLARPFSYEGSQLLYTQVAGTLGYFSPEYATQGQLSEKADVYSYGIVVLEVVSGRKCIDNSLVEEKVYLRNWALEMHKKGKLFDILQPQLKEKCVGAEVIRAINIGLLCVQNDPLRRPTMAEVVTMFLGNVDVTRFLDNFNSSHYGLNNDLIASDNDYSQLFNLQSLSVIEESDELHLLNVDSQHSSRTDNGSCSVELGSLVGHRSLR